MSSSPPVVALWSVLDDIEALRGKRPPPTPKIKDPPPVTPESVNRAVGLVRGMHKSGIQLPDQVAATYSGAIRLEWHNERGKRVASLQVFQSGAVRCRLDGWLSGNTVDAMWSLVAATNLLRAPLRQGAPLPTDEELGIPARPGGGG